MNGAASGHFYENYVVIELIKTLSYSKTKANLSYYRDSNAKEVDVFIEADGTIHPIEIKKSAQPKKQEVRKFELLDKASIKRGTGGIICMCEQPLPIDEKMVLFPVILYKWKLGENKRMYYTYMLRCKDESIYTGITTDIERRLEEHVKKTEKGAKYTRNHGALKMEAVWQSKNRADASKLEYWIKHLTKKQKEQLIQEDCLEILEGKINIEKYKRV